MTTVTQGNLSFDPSTLADDVLAVSNEDFEPLARIVSADAGRRVARATALAQAEAAVVQYINAGGTVDVVKTAAQNLVSVAQQLSSNPPAAPTVAPTDNGSGGSTSDTPSSDNSSGSGDQPADENSNSSSNTPASDSAS